MKKIFYFLIFVFGVNIFAQNDTIVNNETKLKVSIINLIANPKEYHNKLVAFTGFLYLSRESFIFLNRDDFKNKNYRNSIYVALSIDEVLKFKKDEFDRKYVYIIGRFYATAGGFEINCCNGLLTNVLVYNLH